jgi:hypothetical protein
MTQTYEWDWSDRKEKKEKKEREDKEIKQAAIARSQLKGCSEPYDEQLHLKNFSEELQKPAKQVIPIELDVENTFPQANNDIQGTYAVPWKSIYRSINNKERFASILSIFDALNNGEMPDYVCEDYGIYYLFNTNDNYFSVAKDGSYVYYDVIKQESDGETTISQNKSIKFNIRKDGSIFLDPNNTWTEIYNYQAGNQFAKNISASDNDIRSIFYPENAVNLNTDYAENADKKKITTTPYPVSNVLVLVQIGEENILPDNNEDRLHLLRKNLNYTRNISKE